MALSARIISIGKVRQRFVLEGEKEYLPRLRSFFSLSFVELGAAEGASAVESQQREGQALLQKVKPGEHLVVLDERGAQFTSLQFAEWLRARQLHGAPLLFALGGAYGWPEEVRARADTLLSLSSLTFPYQLTRLILVEQLYRAATIVQGHPYHK